MFVARDDDRARRALSSRICTDLAATQESARRAVRALDVLTAQRAADEAQADVEVRVVARTSGEEQVYTVLPNGRFVDSDGVRVNPYAIDGSLVRS